MKTTQEIYEAMRQAMAERAGAAPDESCELAVRLYAAAAQIESLYAYADWSRKQCFPQTASGEYLDLHAGLHGLTRDAAICARGTLIVGLDHVLDAPLTVPAGTRFCIPGGVFYRLDEDCRIPAGLAENEAAAVCLTPGPVGNAAPGEVCGLVEAPTYVTSVRNPLAFTGGTEAESDEHLRQRILSACRRLPNGANAAWYEAAALSVPGITSAAAIPAYPAAGQVGLCISGNYGLPQDGQIIAVQEALSGRTELGVTLTLLTPTVTPVNVALTVWPVDGVSGQDALSAVRAAVEAHFAKPLLMRGFYRSELGSRIYETGLVKNYAFGQGTADLPPGARILYTLGTVQLAEGA